jgi:hypothetical protein
VAATKTTRILDQARVAIEKTLAGLPFDLRVVLEVESEPGVAPVEATTCKAFGVRVCKVDSTEERYVLGIVLEPQDPQNPVDSQGDVYDAETIRLAAYRFMEEYRNIGLQHSGLINDKVKILESWIQREDTVIGGQNVLAGSWLMAVRVLDDELWAAVKDGKITGFSIGGKGKRTSVAE